jgi:type I restriction enzyme M protein
MRFNVVVANPPFSLDKWGHDGAGSDRYGRFHRGVPPRTRGDWAFISHMIETLDKVDGRMGVVVPHGVLFRGASEKRIRTAVLKENLVDGVIGLPANLFFGVGIPAALLLLRHGRRPGEGVLFVDASREFEKGKNQNVLRPEDLNQIVDTWEQGKDVLRYAHVAPMNEIEANDFNLNVSLYVDTFEEEEAVDLAALKAEIATLDAQLAESRKELDKSLRELGL